MSGVLRLEVKDYDGPTRWRWVLKDATGAFMADHEVRLDEGSWQYEAFTSLEYYISSYAALDRYEQDEARIVGEVGQWLESKMFGQVAESLARAARRAPVTVRVVVPNVAKGVLFRPLELAYADGRPLAVQDVTLVMQVAGDDSADGMVPVGSGLRVLGLFSLPEGEQPLSLRRERHALVQTIGRIAARGRAVEVLALQYGVTRDRLRGVLEEAEGWDVIHISGHGAPGELVLETASGGLDVVTAAELSEMLAPARERLKLVTVSACWSAAATVDEQRRLLGLPARKTRVPARAGGDSSPAGAVATELTERLGCAVLAMRFSVDDDFAIELSEKLYELLADKGQSLARAVGMTVRELTTRDRLPALAAATPALFGGRAAELKLAAPSRTTPRSYETEGLKMAGFPPQPERFVGRTGVMARSSAALADESGIPGVLLHGMPGGGKTACALELAYTHEQAFERLVWYKAPDEGMDISGALTRFAVALERDLEGFQMAHLVGDTEKLAGFLPRLTKLMEQNRILLVIDNSESLMNDSSQWRDDRWRQVISALTAHRGLGRVVVTSRRVPAQAPGVIPPGSAPAPGLIVETVDALSADEALLLAHELPHLRDLINGELPGIGRDTARALAVSVLSIAQGHPKLLELADGQARHPERLSGLIAAGNQAWLDQGGLPDGFFTSGETAASPGDYLRILATWTSTVTDSQSPGERDLFWFLCCLEEPDRERAVLDALWSGLWTLLGRDGQPPVLDIALQAVADRGLIVQLTSTDGRGELFVVHPGVSHAGRAQAGKPFQDTVDAAAAFFWRSGLDHASGADGQRPVNTALMVRAGFAAVPYLVRQGEWGTAAAVLEFAFNRDPSQANAEAVLPLAQAIARHVDSAALLLAVVAEAIDPAAAEAPVPGYLADAVARGDYRTAMIAAGRLANRRLHSGRLGEALAFADQAVSHAQQAGMGPWTMLGAEVQRLQMLSETQDASRVLPEVQRLRDLMKALGGQDSSEDEAARSWDVREALWNIDRAARIELGDWDEALAVNAEIIASMHGRQAPHAQLAVARMNDYGPLLRLGKASEARDVLLACRQAFQDAGDLRMLGLTLGALADVEQNLDHFDTAIRLVCDALRYSYMAGDVGAVGDLYHNLGNYLIEHARQPIPALACHLCATLIKSLSGAADTERSVRAASGDLYISGGAIEPPADIADLAKGIGEIPGTTPEALILRLSPHPGTAERALQDLITRALEGAQALPGNVAR